jgi:large subunit ribosomal protein L21
VPVAEATGPEQKQESEHNVYAIVRAGGRQEKVSVGDVLIIDKVRGEAGDSIELTPLMLVEGSTVTTDASTLAKVKVTAEVVKATKGPKITIMKFKNKTGYRKRQGHRQHSTQIRVTAIQA